MLEQNVRCICGRQSTFDEMDHNTFGESWKLVKEMMGSDMELKAYCLEY